MIETGESDRRHPMRSRHLTAVTLTVALAVSVAACGKSDSTSSSTATTTDANSAPRADEAAYEGPGPYIAGTTTLTLDTGRKVEVWYPADPGAQGSTPKAIFQIRDLIPENLQSLVPDDLNPKYETNAYREIPASNAGPFPLVLFAHGFAAYPTEYQTLLTHLASWGFVVAAPDFSERGLLATLSGSTTRIDETAVMGATRELMTAQSAAPTGLLTGKVDTAKVGTAGHAAGVGPAVGYAAADPSVSTFIAMSGGGFRSSTATTTEPPAARPTQPGLVMTGGKDQVAALDGVKDFYGSLDAPKRLVIIDDGGHNGFDDLCLIGADKGGVVEIARKVGIPVPDQLVGLFNDGCTADYLPAAQVWPVAGHFMVAQLRWTMGIDKEPVGLGPGVVGAFEPTKVTYEQQS